MTGGGAPGSPTAGSRARVLITVPCLERSGGVANYYRTFRDFFEDGRMGFVTESRDPAVFAGFLARLVADPALRASIGRYNREYARSRFAASVVAARLLEIYAQVGRQAKAH